MSAKRKTRFRKTDPITPASTLVDVQPILDRLRVKIAKLGNDRKDSPAKTESLKTKIGNLETDIARLKKEIGPFPSAKPPKPDSYPSNFFDPNAAAPRISAKKMEVLAAAIFHDDVDGKTPPPPEKMSCREQVIEVLLDADEERSRNNPPLPVPNPIQDEVAKTQEVVKSLGNARDWPPSSVPPYKTGLDKENSLNIFRSLEGRVLTILDASSSDRVQREALKTLIRKEFRSTMTSVEVSLTPPR